jgi:hypothetical protein
MQRSRPALRLTAIILIAVPTFVNAQTNSKPSATQPGQITSTGNLSVRRFSQSATLLPNGKVLIAGGMERNGKYDASAELYDPRSGEFTPAGNMSSAREGHAAILLRNGKVLLAGGSSGPDGNLATAELYDPASGAFHLTGNMTTPRSHPATVLLNDGKVLLIGGDGAREDERLSSAELYDPATGRFTATGSMHVPREMHTAALLKDGRVLVVGGSSAGSYPNSRIEASAEIYDPATGRFTMTGSMSVPRHKLAAALLPDGKVLVVGGSDNRDWRGQYASAELYDPVTGRFSNDGEMSFRRFKLIQTAVRLTDGRVLIAGGAERAEIYNPATKKFQPVNGTVGESRYFSSATLLNDGRVLIAGGYGDDPMAGAVPNAWLYQP